MADGRGVEAVSAALRLLKRKRRNLEWQTMQIGHVAETVVLQFLGTVDSSCSLYHDQLFSVYQLFYSLDQLFVPPPRVRSMCGSSPQTRVSEINTESASVCLSCCRSV